MKDYIVESHGNNYNMPDFNERHNDGYYVPPYKMAETITSEVDNEMRLHTYWSLLNSIDLSVNPKHHNNISDTIADRVCALIGILTYDYSHEQPKTTDTTKRRCDILDIIHNGELSIINDLLEYQKQYPLIPMIDDLIQKADTKFRFDFVARGLSSNNPHLKAQAKVVIYTLFQ